MRIYSLCDAGFARHDGYAAIRLVTFGAAAAVLAASTRYLPAHRWLAMSGLSAATLRATVTVPSTGATTSTAAT